MRRVSEGLRSHLAQRTMQTQYASVIAGWHTQRTMEQLNVRLSLRRSQEKCSQHGRHESQRDSSCAASPGAHFHGSGHGPAARCKHLTYRKTLEKRIF